MIELNNNDHSFNHNTGSEASYDSNLVEIENKKEIGLRFFLDETKLDGYHKAIKTYEFSNTQNAMMKYVKKLQIEGVEVNDHQLENSEAVND